MFKNKKILITGHLGLIGKELWYLLKNEGSVLYGADLKNGYDLKYLNQCLKLTKDMDYVFLLHGIKGNPKMTNERPLDFFVPMVLSNTNMIESCRVNSVKKVLYTSSIAVENMESDKFPAIAKLLGEQQIEASRIQYPNDTKFCITRPANIYGKFENYNRNDLMVIADLIKKGLTSTDGTLEIWGDGLAERDFLNAKDAALGMIEAMKTDLMNPLNLCSGEGVKIIDIAKIICEELNLKLKTGTQNIGSKKRVMKKNWNNPITVNIKDGIKEAIHYAKQNYFKEK